MFRQFRQTNRDTNMSRLQRSTPPPKKVSNFTWELQPRYSTSVCNYVCSFQTRRKRWEWQLKAGTHIPKGVLLRVGEVGFLSYPQKKTWKEGKTNALHVSNTCLTICLIILTSFEGIFGRLSSCNDMFLVGVFAIVFGLAPNVTEGEFESSLIIWQKRRGFMGGNEAVVYQAE